MAAANNAIHVNLTILLVGLLTDTFFSLILAWHREFISSITFEVSLKDGKELGCSPTGVVDLKMYTDSIPPLRQPC